MMMRMVRMMRVTGMTRLMRMVRIMRMSMTSMRKGGGENMAHTADSSRDSPVKGCL